MSQFKFIIHRPVFEPMNDSRRQVVTISAVAPTLAYAWILDEVLADESKMKLAMSELKLRMIEEILSGEWEVIRE